ncbi:hypothetical protein E4M02_01380 [Brevundimonas sp. S30B]|jgi:hypothetical protein|uniref:hypothetical protein n=1 Tax=unclassified Brevundimonas TaxID=2622653 RepID=UPI001071BE98|nr:MULTISPECIES: hypothetical protein [unclassified Brevundimonas]QBX37439.1 hypothetical protein E4M01_06440 [Brevundimonas sp. MF30-B]TFW03768.1 hypothetical protein E4M02_01380 [Brevundimonas sp. S30B]
MKRQILALAAAAGMAVALGGMSSAGAASSSGAAQHWPGNEDFYCFGYDNCWPVAFRYEVYSDETMTELIHTAADGCNGGPFVSAPWLPAGHTVRERMYVCSSYGPYLPHDW